MFKYLFFLLLFTGSLFGQYAGVFDSATYLDAAITPSRTDAEDWTYEIWLYVLTPSSNDMFNNNAGGSIPRFANISGVFQFRDGGSIWRGTATIDSSEWNHYAVVYESNGGAGADTLFTYKNGLPVDTVAVTTALSAIGRFGANNTPAGYFDGYADEIRWWTDVRTNAEILANYTKELTADAGLLYVWNFNDQDLTSDATANTYSETAGTVTYTTSDPFDNFYIDGDKGNDSNTGVEISSPWQTIAKVNGRTFQPNDFIYFRTDDTWNETLTIPSSGTSGNQITISYYDSTGESGTYPIVDQIDVNNKNYITISNCITVTNGIINKGTGYVLDTSECPLGRKGFRVFKMFKQAKIFK